MVFLFIGEDEFAKDEKLNQIKRDILGKNTKDFNLDVLYAKDIALVDLQESLSRLPIDARRRIVVVKDALKLKPEIKDFILTYCQKPYKTVILILDIRQLERKDTFLNNISKYAKLFRFKESYQINTFKLAEEIDRKNPATCLTLLTQLLSQGEKPEMIMGGLRYYWERGYSDYGTREKRLAGLLNCDLDIKRGRVKPSFALEKLVISLCL